MPVLRASDNRQAEASTNEWLTPLAIVRCLGKFDLDPCCPPTMPWRTATTMISLNAKRSTNFITKGDGLLHPWKGRVISNNPYDHPLPWVQKMAAHGNGILIEPGKSPDTRWGQLLWSTADAVLLPRSRICFCFPSGQPSTGKYSPNLFAAYGAANVAALRRLQRELCPGVLLDLKRGKREVSS